jgi:hypothetical protein
MRCVDISGLDRRECGRLRDLASDVQMHSNSATKPVNAVDFLYLLDFWFQYTVFNTIIVSL